MIALARKYRPRRFADLLVQDHVAAALRGAVVRNRVGHGYLFTGPRGVGKTTAARILAMALNCERRDRVHADGEPCGECAHCGRIWSGGASLDVVEIDAASNRGVDDARDLRERAMYAPSEAGHHKVYIVDEAHMLTREAWNALLKILEEPPPRVVFVFATTEPQKIANTASPVLSRLQRFDFRRIGAAAIRQRLREVLAAESLDADDDALTLIARHADGGMRDALSILDQCLSLGGERVTAARVRDILGLVGDELYAEALRLVADRQASGVFPLVDRLVDAGADLAEFMAGLGDLLRALAVVQLGGSPEGLTEGLRETIETARQRLAPEDTVRMLRLLGDTETAVRRSANPRLALETLLLRWALMDRMVDLEALLGPSRGGAAPEAVPDRAAPPPRSSPPPSPPPSPPGASAGEGRSAAPTGPLPFTLAALQDAWPRVVEFGRRESPFLGEVLAAAKIEAVEPPTVRLQIAAEHGVLRGALDRGRDAVENYLGQLLGSRVVLLVEWSEPPGPASARRLSEAAMRSERLRSLRQMDPALDAAAEELDLEIVEDRPPGPR